MMDKGKLHTPHQTRSPVRGSQNYKTLRQEITVRKHLSPPPIQKDIFSMTITATRQKGEPMDEAFPETALTVNEQQFLINLIFKPIEPGLRLRPEEIQLLLAYMGEILKEIEEEEKRIIEEEKATPEQG